MHATDFSPGAERSLQKSRLNSNPMCQPFVQNCSAMVVSKARFLDLSFAKQRTSNDLIDNASE